MNNSFTDWDNSLAHYGIPGMKWGVRRYMNKDGSLTKAGEKRYGSGSKKFVSKYKMQRDYKNLDKGLANTVARQAHNEHDYKEVKKGIFGGWKADKASKERAATSEENEGYMKSIEAMQRRVVAKATSRGFTVNSKEVVRTADFGRKEAMKILDGKVGSHSYTSVQKEEHYVNVTGSEIKLKKNR